MKILNFLIISILFSINCFGQKTALSDKISVNLPDRTEVLNKDKFAININSKFSHSKSALYIIPGTGEHTDNKHFYKVDDILVKLVHGPRRLADKENYLSVTKKYYDSMNSDLKGSNHYSSAIKTINNNHILITYDDWENVGYYNFYCNDSTNTQALNGTLQFDVADKNKATKVLDDILNGIEFKK